MTPTAQLQTSQLPASIRSARLLLAAVAVCHLIVPVVMCTRRDALRDQIATQHPDFSAAGIARSGDIAVASAALFHGILLVLCALLVWKLRTARAWTRRLTIVSQLLSVVFSAVSWSSSPMFHVVIPIVGAAQILVVILVWTPPSARTFFARRPTGPEPADPA